MAMRYIVRRKSPEDLSEIKKLVPSLDKDLGQPGADYRRFVKVEQGDLKHVQFTLMTRKAGTGWVWTCPNIEIVAEDERGLIELTEKFGGTKPAHLAHLPI